MKKYLLEREPGDSLIFKEIDFEDLLSKYGPEGLYDLAKELMKVADKDVSDAISDSYEVEEDWLVRYLSKEYPDWLEDDCEYTN